LKLSCVVGREVAKTIASARLYATMAEEVFMNKRENVSGTTVLETHEIGIAGMTCDHCVRRVEKALRGVNGVTEVRVDRPAARATVTFDSTKTNIPALHDALLASGYRPKAVGVE